MDLFEARDFFQSQNPGKNINFEFDDNCHRFCEFVMTEGNPNLIHHVECRKVKVTVDGQNPIYVPIKPHRLNVYWSDLKNLIMNKSDVFFHDQDLKSLLEIDPKDYEAKMQEYVKASGLSKDKIESKLSAFKSNQDIQNN